MVNASAVHYFRSRLAAWFKTNKRDFPWRHSSDPYQLLMAEVMLRRTRAAQVAPVFRQFITRFPNIRSLDDAPEAAVVETVSGLGLSWRAPHFKLIARQLVETHAGTVPSTHAALTSLPGVGDYVADAVRCFGFGEKVAVVDTNTVRLAGRYLGFRFGPESRRQQAVIEAVQSLIDTREPEKSNMALLDFAAAICRAPRPLCGACPVARHCQWFKTSGNGGTGDTQLSQAG